MALRLVFERSDEREESKENYGSREGTVDKEDDSHIKGANLSFISVCPDRMKLAICRSKESSSLYIYNGLTSFLDHTHISQLQSSENIANDAPRKSTRNKENAVSQMKKRKINNKRGAKDTSCLSSCIKYRIPEELVNGSVPVKEDQDSRTDVQKNTMRANITALKWISTSHLAIGFESGLLRVINSNGEDIYTVRFEKSPIVSIKSYPIQALSEYESDIWIMFETSSIVILPYYTIAALQEKKSGRQYTEDSKLPSSERQTNNCESPLKGSYSSDTKGKPVISPNQEALLTTSTVNKLNYKIYRFEDHLDVFDYGVFPKLPPYFSHTAQAQTLSTYLSNFISTSAPTTTYLLSGGGQNTFNLMSSATDPSSHAFRKDNICILCGGAEPTFGFYTLGESQGIRDIGEVVNIVKKKITQAVVGTVGSILPWVGGNLLFGNSTKKSQMIDPYSPASSISNSRASFENGVVKVELQGSCSGCPSSLMTLKQGVQNLLKHYVKEVNSVEAI